MSRQRTLIALIAAMTLTQAALAILFVATPIILTAREFGAAGVGFVAALYGLGFVFGALFTPKVIADVGHIRAFAVFASLGAATTLMLGALDGALGWGLLRLLTGVCVAGLFIVGESWIADAAPAERRGGVLSVYAVVSRLGLIIGPFLVAGGDGGTGLGALMAAGALLALSLSPVAATPQTQPAAPSTERFDVMALISLAPAAVAGVLTAGFVNGSILQLAPLYAAAGADTPLGAAAGLNAAILLGALVVQWPAGRFSDRMDRRKVIAGLAAIGAVGAFLLGVTPPSAPGWWVMVCAVVLGGGSLSYYAVCVAHAADRAPSGQLTRITAALLLVWATGAAIGPLVAGVFMGPLGPGALFWLAAIANGALAFVMLRRRAAREEAPVAEKDKFAPVLATSGGFGALIACEPVDPDARAAASWADEAPDDTTTDVAADVALQPNETAADGHEPVESQLSAAGDTDPTPDVEDAVIVGETLPEDVPPTEETPSDAAPSETGAIEAEALPATEPETTIEPNAAPLEVSPSGVQAPQETDSSNISDDGASSEDGEKDKR